MTRILAPFSFRVLLWALVFPLGCFYPADRGRALEARVDKLATDNAQISNELRVERQKLETTLAQVTQALESLEKGSRRSTADVGVQLQKNFEDVAQLRGQVETYLNKLAELEAMVKQVQEAGEKQLADLKGSDTYKLADSRKRAEEAAKSGDKKQYLAIARERAAAGDVAVARVLYADFMKKWPKDENISEAHYGLGETFFAEDKCREAMFEYSKVVQDHPKSKFAPDALLRSSECFTTLKMNDESKLALEELVRSYPRSDAARKAKTRLDELNKKKPAARKPVKK